METSIIQQIVLAGISVLPLTFTLLSRDRHENLCHQWPKRIKHFLPLYLKENLVSPGVTCTSLYFLSLSKSHIKPNSHAKSRFLDLGKLRLLNRAEICLHRKALYGTHKSVPDNYLWLEWRLTCHLSCLFISLNSQ